MECPTVQNGDMLWLDPLYHVLYNRIKIHTVQSYTIIYCTIIWRSYTVQSYSIIYCAIIWRSYTVQNALTGSTVVDAIAISGDSSVATASHWFLFLSLFLLFSTNFAYRKNKKYRNSRICYSQIQNFLLDKYRNLQFTSSSQVSGRCLIHSFVLNKVLNMKVGQIQKSAIQKYRTLHFSPLGAHLKCPAGV